MKSVKQTKSKDAIYKALIRIMANKNFEDITIVEITKDANVARRTYYSNFESKYDIINYGNEIIIHKFIEILKSSNNYSFRVFTNLFFSYFKEYASLINLIEEVSIKNINTSFINTLLNYKNELNLYFNLSDDPYLFKFQIEYLTEIFKITLMKWYKNDFNEDIDTLANVIISTKDILR